MHIKEFSNRFVGGIMIAGLLISFMTSSLPAAHALVTDANFVPTTRQAATLVLGQATFTTKGSATLRNRLNYPSAVAVDPTTGKIFVADSDNNRVLRYASAAALINGANADGVLGRPNFTSKGAATTQRGMSFHLGVFVDKAGRLWVADGGNNRVLRFDHAATKPYGAPANAVLGEPNFITSTGGTTQKRMSFPLAVFVDAGGRLWVADGANNRVLRFDNAAAKINGANADGVLGQLNFTSYASATTQRRMAWPEALAVDAAGRLWVADSDNCRVLRFENAAAKPNGALASGVVGQPNFTTSNGGTSRNRMGCPGGVAVDGSGRLYVSDMGNNRIMVFNSAAALQINGNASYVLGQINFTTGTANAGGISAKSLNMPAGMFYDPTKKVLWAADRGNNRVLRYGQ